MFKSRVMLPTLMAVFRLVVPTQLPAETPSVSYLFPAGGQRGTTVDVNVGGHYLHDVCDFEVMGTGVKSSGELRRATQTRWFEGPVIPLPDSQQKENYPRDQVGSISIAPDAEPGIRHWRVWTSQGACESMKFVVGNLPEVIEAEIDGDPLPTPVTLPVTINGRIFPREDVDVWTFEAHAGQSYTCDVMANRLGSPLDSRLEVIDPDGVRIAENTDRIGTDSLLRFVAQIDGVYQVRIHDIRFDGLQHFVYRLTITAGPYVDTVYPLGGRRGSVTAFQLFGQAVDDVPLEITLPQTVAGHLLHHVERDGVSSNAFPIQLSDHDEFLESEPNDTAADALLISIPAVVNGRIDFPGDTDTWRFPARKDQIIRLELQAERLGSDLDSVLVVQDADGRELARNDDLDDKHTDSALQFTAAEDGQYSVTVTERFGSRGGQRFAYRLHIGPPATPDFSLTMPSDSLTVIRGAEAKLKIAVTRTGGFEGEVQVKVDDLPPGVTVSGDTIAAKKKDIDLVFKADESAAIGPIRLQIAGTAVIAEESVSHIASKPATLPDEVDTDHLLLAIAMPTPFKFAGAFQTTYVARGATFTKHYSIDRGDFAGPIEISLADRQTRHLQGVTGPTIVVPPGESEFEYTIKLPSWMEIGRTSRTCLMATGVVQDTDGRRHKVCYASDQQNDQLIVLVDPGQLEISAHPASVLVVPGGSARVHVKVGRGQGLMLPVTAELQIPEHIRGVTASAITLSPDQSSGILDIQFSDDSPGPFNIPLTITATAYPNGTAYTAETSIDFVRNFSK